MNATICEAIDQMYLLEFQYADSEGVVHRRVIEPYVYGQTRQGNEAIRAYQVQGTSESEMPGWKLFRVDRIIGGIDSLSQHFAADAPGYAHSDQHLDLIFCLVP